MEGTTMDARAEARLHAYHDGELSGLARWWFERELRRSPDLQRELASLRRLSGLLRDHEAEAGDVDLWDRIALGLPGAEDAPGESYRWLGRAEHGDPRDGE